MLFIIPDVFALYMYANTETELCLKIPYTIEPYNIEYLKEFYTKATQYASYSRNVEYKFDITLTECILRGVFIRGYLPKNDTIDFFLSIDQITQISNRLNKNVRMSTTIELKEVEEPTPQQFFRIFNPFASAYSPKYKVPIAKYTFENIGKEDGI